MNIPGQPKAVCISARIMGMDERFHVHVVHGHEGLGVLFEYQVDLSNQNEPDWKHSAREPGASLKPQDLLGKTLVIALPLRNEKLRHLSGIITKASYMDSYDRHTSYKVTIRPELWLLTLNRNCRIFHDRPALDVVKDILAENQVSTPRESLLPPYRTWDYLTQYQESDFAFIRRVLAQEGLYFYFEHSQKGHTLVLADPAIAHQDHQEFQAVRMGRPKNVSGSDDYLTSWHASFELQSEAVTLADFDFRLKRNVAGMAGHCHVQADSKHEIYDYPAKCVLAESQEGARASQSREEAGRLAEIQLEERRGRVECHQGKGTVRWLAPGLVLSVAGSETENRKFLVTATELTWRNTGLRTGGGPVEEPCEISVCAIDSRIPYRMPMGERPKMLGPQTAWVVGGPEQEICTDRYGRIKVQFHWDRESQGNGKNSCWLRVAQPWAGNRWGAISIPRVGNEVVVGFLEGDPDRPLVTGGVYDGENMPPYDLPEHQTQSGIKTRSSKGGTAANFNEIRFEDKKDQEELHIQAERNMSTLVKHDQTLNVQGHRSVEVAGNEIITVKGSRSQTISLNETQHFMAMRKMMVGCTNTDEIVGPHRGDFHGGRTEVVENGDSLTVVASDKTTMVDGEYNISANQHYGLQVGAGSNCTMDLKDGVTTILADEEIRLACGAASIILKKDGTVEIKGAKQVRADGADAKLELKSDGASLDGKHAAISGVQQTTITGRTVKIN